MTVITLESKKGRGDQGIWGRVVWEKETEMECEESHSMLMRNTEREL